MDWLAHQGVDTYELQWDTTNLFSSLALQTHTETYNSSASGNNDTDEFTGTLLNNQTYFWRVRAINAVDTTEWRSRIFSTGSAINLPEVPTLIAPADAATVIASTVTFDWSDALNTTEYELEYDTDNSFATSTTISMTGSNHTPSGIVPNETYYWRVRSKNGGVISDWSSVWSFNTVSCFNSTASINPTSCGGAYTSPSGINYTTSGTYTDIVPNATGCDSVITIHLTVTTINTGVALNTGVLTASEAGATYRWLDCDNDYGVLAGANQQSYQPTSSGNYAVEITKGSCSDTSSCENVVVTSIADLNDLTHFEAYVHPNPSNGNFSVYTNLYQGEIQIFDPLGRLVCEKWVDKSGVTAFSDFNAGLYTVRISIKNQSKVIRLIVP